MKIPLNYYDVALKHRPDFVASAVLDGEDLQKAGRLNPVARLDEGPPRLEAAAKAQMELLVEDLAKLRHWTADRVKFALSTDPYDQNRLKAYITTLEVEYYSFLNFALCGKKVFYFQDGLVQQLGSTVMNMSASLLQLPYPSCMFVFTAPEILEAMYEVTPNAKQQHTIDYEAPLSVFLTMVEPDAEFNYRRLVVMALHADETNTQFFLKRSLALLDDWDLERALHTDWDELIHDDEQRGFQMYEAEDFESSGVTDERFYTEMRLCMFQASTRKPGRSNHLLTSSMRSGSARPLPWRSGIYSELRKVLRDCLMSWLGKASLAFRRKPHPTIHLSPDESSQ